MNEFMRKSTNNSGNNVIIEMRGYGYYPFISPCKLFMRHTDKKFCIHFTYASLHELSACLQLVVSSAHEDVTSIHFSHAGVHELSAVIHFASASVREGVV